MNARHIVVGSGSTLGTGEAVMSDAVRIGDLLLLSGRAAVDPATLQVVPGGFDAQARSVLADIDRVLDAGGSSRSQVARVECFLADPGDFPAWNQIWLEHFAAPRPARTTVVCGFAVAGLLIELQVTAAVRGAGA
jgi:2-iminobutanoate/2-iminopropanoate deaminase